MLPTSSSPRSIRFFVFPIVAPVVRSAAQVALTTVILTTSQSASQFILTPQATLPDPDQRTLILSSVSATGSAQEVQPIQPVQPVDLRASAAAVQSIQPLSRLLPGTASAQDVEPIELLRRMSLPVSSAKDIQPVQPVRSVDFA